jgi:hypothetical protein
METLGVGGVLMRCMVCMGWIYGKITRGAGGFPSHARIVVGDGSKIKFWHDMW